MRRKKDASETNKNSGERLAGFTVTENSTLLPFLMEKMPDKSRNNLKSLLRFQQVLVDGISVSQFNHPLVAGQRIEISSQRMMVRNIDLPFELIFEDEHLVVVNKPAGLLSIATKKEKRETLYSFVSDYVKLQNQNNKIFIVHRLDRETSGIMLFAKNEQIKVQLQEAWKEMKAERTYIALVEGKVNEKEGVVSSFLFEDNNFRMHSSQNQSKGQKAVTHFSVLKSNNSWSLLKINLETGRKNQIRVHMQDMGHSIAGDKKYGATTNPINRLGLHAQKLSFQHPATNQILTFESKIPRIFKKVL
ncbi:MAG: RluA family pseudouridine synthase [Prolixibacteraceae bacterium]|nr:RluA family pseudouridine synthase [Prolixibacteraceae bacterium]